MKTSKAIKNRVTVKVLGNEKEPLKINEEIQDVIADLVETAGWAPFHYACHKSHRDEQKLPSVVPWRYYVLGPADCRKLLDWMMERKLEAGKISQMLATVDSLVMVTWLPDPAGNDDEAHYALTDRNIEHIAATAASVQNLLLAATEKGIRSYWSSGGILREELLYDLMGIPAAEPLLAAVFLFPEKTGNAEVVGGKLRKLREVPESWSRWVTLDTSI